MKGEDHTHNNRNKSYTSDENKKVRWAHVCIRYILYAKRVAAETEIEETA